MQKLVLEIRPAAGGDEAKIWANDLLRMYFKFAQAQGWEVKKTDQLILKIRGNQAFDQLQFESGVHRVQRVPTTEKHGRIHTSTASVAVLPETEASQIVINPSDLEWQFFRASTQGGQNVQKVNSAVRLKHKPTGMIVTAQEERFQQQNRDLAMTRLQNLLIQRQKANREAKVGAMRQDAVGHGMRAEKIRTYNFPNNRVTDHRLKKKFRLEDILNGRLEKLTQKFFS